MRCFYQNIKSLDTSLKFFGNTIFPENLFSVRSKPLPFNLILKMFFSFAVDNFLFAYLPNILLEKVSLIKLLLLNPLNFVPVFSVDLINARYLLVPPSTHDTLIISFFSCLLEVIAVTLWLYGDLSNQTFALLLVPFRLAYFQIQLHTLIGL